MANTTIVFTGGGTLGPVTPLLAVIREVRAMAPDAAVAWIGTADGPEERLVTAAGLPFHAVSAGKMRRYFSWRNFTDPFRVVGGFFAARSLLKRLGADAVVSAGGFVAVPVAWAAWSLGVPVHVHQQDVRPGLANRLSLPVARSMSVALEKSLEDFKRHRPVWTGNPVRDEVGRGSFDAALQAFGLERGLPTVLVLGGGTGAAGLNKLVWGSLPSLTAAAQVIHVAGPGKNDASIAAMRYHQYELLTTELADAYAAADLVVTRAGMGVLTELAALGKPAVIVPMPGSHQEDNARAFADAAGALTLDEGRLTPDAFAVNVLGLLGDDARLEACGAGMRRMHKPDAAKAIAAIVMEAARGHHARR